MNEFIRRVVNTLLLKKKKEQKTKTPFFLSSFLKFLAPECIIGTNKFKSN